MEFEGTNKTYIFKVAQFSALDKHVVFQSSVSPSGKNSHGMNKRFGMKAF